MPAVQLNILKQQINELIWKYTQPDEFLNCLHDLLDHYANRVYRPGETVHNIYKGKIYNTPQVVLNQIIIELIPLINENPKRMLLIADSLWEDDYLETRKLGISILGNIPPDEFDSVLSRIQDWSKSADNKTIMDILLLDGSKTIRQTNPAIWLDQINLWLKINKPEIQIIGLKAMLPLISDISFNDLPPLYNKIEPFFLQESYPFHNELFLILDGLIKRSPIETGFFLKQVLSSGVTKDNLRIIRKFIPRFNKKTQDDLRTSISSALIIDS